MAESDRAAADRNCQLLNMDLAMSHPGSFAFQPGAALEAEAGETCFLGMGFLQASIDMPPSAFFRYPSVYVLVNNGLDYHSR
jgi:hypothetical protein